MLFFCFCLSGYKDTSFLLVVFIFEWYSHIFTQILYALFLRPLKYKLFLPFQRCLSYVIRAMPRTLLEPFQYGKEPRRVFNYTTPDRSQAHLKSSISHFGHLVEVSPRQLSPPPTGKWRVSRHHRAKDDFISSNSPRIATCTTPHCHPTYCHPQCGVSCNFTAH